MVKRIQVAFIEAVLLQHLLKCKLCLTRLRDVLGCNIIVVLVAAGARRVLLWQYNGPLNTLLPLAQARPVK